jgi:hypothetical protein
MHEIEHDGFRLPARKEGQRVMLRARRGTNYTDSADPGEAKMFPSDGHGTLRGRDKGAVAASPIGQSSITVRSAARSLKKRPYGTWKCDQLTTDKIISV